MKSGVFPWGPRLSRHVRLGSRLVRGSVPLRPVRLGIGERPRCRGVARWTWTFDARSGVGPLVHWMIWSSMEIEIQWDILQSYMEDEWWIFYRWIWIRVSIDIKYIHWTFNEIDDITIDGYEWDINWAKRLDTVGLTFLFPDMQAYRCRCRTRAGYTWISCM